MRVENNNFGYMMSSAMMSMAMMALAMSASSSYLSHEKKSQGLDQMVKQVRDLATADPSICTGALAGTDISVGVAPITAALGGMPVDTAVTAVFSNIQAIDANKSRINVDIGIQYKNAERHFSGAAIATRDTMNFATSCYFTGGPKTAEQTCTEIGGLTRSGSPGTCFVGDDGSGIAFAAPLSAWANYIGGDLSYAAVAGYLADAVVLDFLAVNTIENANIALALNADPGISVATKNVILNALTNIGNQFGAYTALASALETNPATAAFRGNAEPFAVKYFWRFNTAPDPFTITPNAMTEEQNFLLVNMNGVKVDENGSTLPDNIPGQ